jgi:hydroxymethylpyrimidine/phosphomethylpyrimidine kinase
VGADAAIPPTPTPILVIAVGGLDPRGAAGLVRDFATIRALDAEPYLVPTAYTTQSVQAVQAVDTRPEDELRQALAVALATAEAGARRPAVKIGMIGAEPLACVLVAALAGFDGPVVYDPVLAASNGGALYQGAVGGLLPLLARASLVTPNLSEAQALTGLRVTDLPGARAAARRLLALGARAVLVKGGHLAGAADDLLVTAEGEQLFSGTRLSGRDPRGTGCALASAIAVHLARGVSLGEAVGLSKRWLHGQIAAARSVGSEHWL